MVAATSNSFTCSDSTSKFVGAGPATEKKLCSVPNGRKTNDRIHTLYTMLSGGFELKTKLVEKGLVFFIYNSLLVLRLRMRPNSPLSVISGQRRFVMCVYAHLIKPLKHLVDLKINYSNFRKLSSRKKVRVTWKLLSDCVCCLASIIHQATRSALRFLCNNFRVYEHL